MTPPDGFQQKKFPKRCHHLPPLPFSPLPLPPDDRVAGELVSMVSKLHFHQGTSLHMALECAKLGGKCPRVVWAGNIFLIYPLQLSLSVST